MQTVDIVVPRQGARASIDARVGALFALAQETPFEVVIATVGGGIDLERDRFGAGVHTVCDAHSIVTAVNRAIALHPERDVVVLRDDACVARDWLDRLARCAVSAGDVGLVAPVVDRGGIVSYAAPPGARLAASELDALFREANAGEWIDAPAAFGPCVYLRRACLDAIGALDPSIGAAADALDEAIEECSVRAIRAGFRARIAGDAYVAHTSAVPQGAQKARGVRRVTRHADALETFRREDRGRALARRVDLLRLARSPRPRLLFVSHAWQGGVRRHMRDLALIVATRCEVLLLEPDGEHAVKLSWLRDGESLSAFFRVPDDFAKLVSLLEALSVARVHVHHVHGLPREVLDLPRMLRVPYDCTLHDYYPVCPQYHMADADGRYCGEPDVRGCGACLASRAAQWQLDIAAWRSLFAEFLRGAERVIAPSRDTADRIRRYIPDLPVVVMPHPEKPLPLLPRVMRVAVCGNLSPAKGLHVVRACAEDACARGLPLAFRVLGPTTEPIVQWPDAPLTVAGEYPEERLAELVAAERPDVLFFPAQVPETYAYTLSVAIASGLPIVASAIGALPERLAGVAGASLVPWQATAREWNAALLAASRAEVAAPPESAPRVVAS